MKKITVIGLTGSGKTTIINSLEEKLSDVEFYECPGTLNEVIDEFKIIDSDVIIKVSNANCYGDCQAFFANPTLSLCCAGKRTIHVTTNTNLYPGSGTEDSEERIIDYILSELKK